jgi:hypothetical protein
VWSLTLIVSRFAFIIFWQAIRHFVAKAAKGNLENGISTNEFLQKLKKASDKDRIKNFANQWIYGSGRPQFTVEYNYNRKKNKLELTLKQVQELEMEAGVDETVDGAESLGPQQKRFTVGFFLFLLLFFSAPSFFFLRIC